MTRYVIDPQVALTLAERRQAPPAQHRLLAPALLRSQVLAQVYAEVRCGTLDGPEARRRLDHVRALPLRLLGDRVLQRAAWDIAQALDWPDTFVAEYIALTTLQADALVTMNAAVADAARRFVAVASLDDLLG